MEMLNIGFHSFININRISSIIPYESNPIKRLVANSEDKGNLIIATHGRRTKSVIITDTGQVITSSITAEALKKRLEEGGPTRKGFNGWGVKESRTKHQEEVSQMG